MSKLIIVTFVWAFSFSLIGEFLRGIDSAYLALSRVGLAFLCFVPFMKFRGVDVRTAVAICAIGAVQIGLMYIFYYKSFVYLKVYEVALFTIFTPFYVTLIYDAFSRRFRSLYLISVAVAVLGAFVMKFDGLTSEFLLGFLLVQGANFCFGAGQSAYKYMCEKKNLTEQKGLFGYFFLGATVMCVVVATMFGDAQKFTPNGAQIAIIVFMGVVSSALCYFLWNKGACEVDAGVLAIMNNALIPAAIIVNLVLWQRDIEMMKFLIGSAIIVLSLIIHKRVMKFYVARKSDVISFD